MFVEQEKVLDVSKAFDFEDFWLLLNHLPLRQKKAFGINKINYLVLVYEYCFFGVYLLILLIKGIVHLKMIFFFLWNTNR